MDPLKIFQQIYGQVPEWARVMHHWAPEALQHYTALRMAVLSNGALPRKEKELILVGINAARRYETSMLYHAQGALDAGAGAAEIADTVLTAVISRGLPAWLEGRKAVEYALEREQTMLEHSRTANQNTLQTAIRITAEEAELRPTNQNRVHPESTPAECEAYYRDMFGEIPTWASLMRDTQPDVFVAYTNLRQSCLQAGFISEKLKELILTGINAAELYALGVDIHARSALAKGASREELAECLLTAVLTAGIPAWFTGYAYLTSTSE